MKNILVAASGGAIDSVDFATALAAARPLGAHMEFSGRVRRSRTLLKPATRVQAPH
jgi:hypothetical protein